MPSKKSTLCPHCGKTIPMKGLERHLKRCPLLTNKGKFRAAIVGGGLPGLGKRP